MRLTCPIDEIVGQFNNAVAGAARIGQVTRGDVGVLQEIDQMFGRGGGKGLINCLVGIAHAYPVAGSANQRFQNILLDLG
ncbi:hypothetical protein SDC9_113920 [bioreactor metagenome]|uniref:Uncharacterized protein n=1 Tax=bioreactor metagenome TaxID=1076179 RepID=A0A645BP18_9ZZZZ